MRRAIEGRKVVVGAGQIPDETVAVEAELGLACLEDEPEAVARIADLIWS